jgi:lysozyme
MAVVEYVPDISHHQAGINIQQMKNEGAAALIARVGQGAGTSGTTHYGTTQDREWARHRDEARRVGLPLVAYWYVGCDISAAENARLARDWVGDTSIPWMIDHENASGSLTFYHSVLDEFTRAGLRVILGYVPHWYWSGAGKSAPLTPGPPLVNSAYRGGSGTAASIYQQHWASDWNAYGGQNVALLQFTNQALYAGYKIDCSAFEGTHTQLMTLINGTTTETQPQGSSEDMIITCVEPNHAGILSGGVLIDISGDPGARDSAQRNIERGIIGEIKVSAATWDLLFATSLVTLPAAGRGGSTEG